MTDLTERMKTRLADWDDEEPRADWWSYQREYAEALDLIGTMRTEISSLENMLQSEIGNSRQLERIVTDLRERLG